MGETEASFVGGGGGGGGGGMSMVLSGNIGSSEGVIGVTRGCSILLLK